MGFGSTAKKLQQVADMAEDVYGRLNSLREEVDRMQSMVNETHDRVDALDCELAEQRALLEALAEERGIDADTVTAAVHVADAGGDGEADESAEPNAPAGDDT
jgi:septal ring factor EnvC (AmiA/AmiB activator)